MWPPRGRAPRGYRRTTMKKGQVKIGKTYAAKVSGGVAPVRITEEVWAGELHKGWKGVNTETGRSVRVKSAQRLRAAVAGVAAPRAAKLPEAATAGDVAPGGDRAAEGVPSRKAASPRPP